jgi:hypothetical protein
MTVLAVIMFVVVAVVAVSAAFGLEGALHRYDIRSEAAEHILDHMVGPNIKNLVSNFRRQMPVSQMPRKAQKLAGIFMRDFDDKFHSCLNLYPSPIFELQAIAIGHRNCFRKVEHDMFALIQS